MNFRFNVTTPDVLRRIHDQESLDALILFCDGKSRLDVAGAVIEDNIEVLFRIGEVLRCLAPVSEISGSYRGKSRFIYEFEPRFLIEADTNYLRVLDRENPKHDGETLSLCEVETLREEIIDDIDKYIRPISNFAAEKLISAKVM